MDNLTQNRQAAADTAEAENKQAAAELGKFKDVKTLMKAYSDLEAEFTRRCQRLKELEKENKAQVAPDGAQNALSQKSGGDAPAAPDGGENTPPVGNDGATGSLSQTGGDKTPPENTVCETRESEEERISNALADAKVRDAVIGDYLKSLAANPVPLIAGGGGISAPRNAPKSVKEAGNLAKRFLNG